MSGNSGVSTGGSAAATRQAPKVTTFGRVMNGVEEAMAKRWSVVFERPWETFKHDDHFFSLGGTDEMAVTLLDLIDDEWGVRLPTDQIAITPVLTQLADVTKVASRLAFGLGGPPEWIAAGEPGRAVVIAEAAMGATNRSWQRMSELLDPRIPIIGVESIAYTLAGIPMTRIEDIAAAHIELLRPMIGDRPVVVTGHSYGGLVGCEVARQLERAGHPVAGVVLLDTPASRKLGREPWTLRRFPAKVRLVARRYKRNTKSRLLVLGRHHVRRWRVMEGEPWVRWVIKSQGVAHRRYKARPRDGDLTLITVDSDALARDELLGWGRLVSGEIDTAWVPGLHEDMLRTDSLPATAAAVNGPLLRLTQPSPSG